MEIRALRRNDERTAFRSGDADLDRFFHKYAGQNQFRLHIGSTYVAVEGERIVGFATVAIGHLEIDALPASRRKGFPNYPLPVLRLARLAVAESARGGGIGAELLAFVFDLATSLADQAGCIGVLVDAKPDARAFYERFGFMPIAAVHGESDQRPAPIPMFLSLAEILAAGK